MQNSQLLFVDISLLQNPSITDGTEASTNTPEITESAIKRASQFQQNFVIVLCYMNKVMKAFSIGRDTLLRRK